MIVKVQRAQFPADAPGLIYDEARSVFVTQYLTPRVLLIMGQDMKAFFDTSVLPSGEVILTNRVADQPW